MSNTKTTRVSVERDVAGTTITTDVVVTGNVTAAKVLTAIKEDGGFETSQFGYNYSYNLRGSAKEIKCHTSCGRY